MKQWLVNFHFQLNNCCHCSETILVVTQFVAEFCFKDAKLLHSFEHSFMSCLNSGHSFPHVTRVPAIDKPILVNVGTHIWVTSIAFISECFFARKMQLVHQLIPEDLDIWVCTTSIRTIDVNNWWLPECNTHFIAHTSSIKLLCPPPSIKRSGFLDGAISSIRGHEMTRVLCPIQPVRPFDLKKLAVACGIILNLPASC